MWCSTKWFAEGGLVYSNHNWYYNIMVQQSCGLPSMSKSIVRIFHVMDEVKWMHFGWFDQIQGPLYQKTPLQEATLSYSRHWFCNRASQACNRSLPQRRHRMTTVSKPPELNTMSLLLTMHTNGRYLAVVQCTKGIFRCACSSSDHREGKSALVKARGR